MNHFYCQIPNRGRIRVGGDDASRFLQDLVTGDIESASESRAVYACLLTAQGRFLHDFFVTKQRDDYLLECEGGARAEDLAARLKRYKLRSAVTLDCEPAATIYAGTGTVPDGNYADPRHPDLGWRGPIAPTDNTPADFSRWDDHRIRLCIPDGSRDLVPEQSLLMENNMDRLHGVSFTKGCFVGQEITARMYHRNLGKKVLMALSFPTTPPAPGTLITDDTGEIGEMRSSCGTIGLALIKRDAVDRLASIGIAHL